MTAVMVVMIKVTCEGIIAPTVGAKASDDAAAEFQPRIYPILPVILIYRTPYLLSSINACSVSSIFNVRVSSGQGL